MLCPCQTALIESGEQHATGGVGAPFNGNLRPSGKEDF